MVGRRDREDPVLTELVKERLAHVLAENRPRRASPAEQLSQTASQRPAARSHPAVERHSAVFGRASAAQALSARSGPPDLEPSDDGEDTSDDRSQPPPAVTPGPSSPDHLDFDHDSVDAWEDPPPRRAFGRAHIGVIVALVLIGLLSAGWAVLRARPVAIASSPPSSTSSVPVRSSSPAATKSSTPSPTSIKVHVLGAVKKPGVVTLSEHARVSDAIEAAGGLRREAEPGDLNLAQVLSDGQQVVIGTDKAPSGEVRDGGQSSGSSDGSGNGTGSSDDAGPKVNLNSASQSQLEALPGVGPVTAGKIVAWREEHGRFSRVEELQEVDGIGPKTFAEISPHAEV